MKKAEPLNSNLEDISGKYKPTKKEVFSKIGFNIGKYVKNSTQEFLKINSTVYIIPTALRLGQKGNKWEEFKSNLGLTLGYLTTISSGAFYILNADNDVLPDKKFWAIPLATNLASGLYEIGRRIYKKQESKMIEEHKKNLEKRAKEE